MASETTDEHPSPTGQLCWQTVYPGPPMAKARPRLSRSGHTFTPASTVAAEKMLALHVAPLIASAIEDPVALRLDFFLNHHRRSDVDNFVKLVMDALSRAGAWVDDSQVTLLHASLDYDHEFPRTEIALYEHCTQLKRGAPQSRTCPVCSSTFVATRSSKKRFCSRACSALSHRKAA